MILITGANGQLGKELQTLEMEFPGLTTIARTRDLLDITDTKAIKAFFDAHPALKYCINCAAYTKVDQAETDEATAKSINATAVKHMSKICQDKGIKFIHISSDYVYHPTEGKAILENSKTQPQSIYAQTKLEGDEFALNNGAMVIRTSWVYSYFGNNFVKTMLRLGKERDQLNIVNDQIGTPTYARDLARVILQIIQKVEKGSIPRNLLQGVYNFSNEGVTSWYDFAKAIFDYSNLSCKALPIPSSHYPTPAKRPLFSVLNKEKIKKIFNIEIPHWQDSLKECLDLLN